MTRKSPTLTKEAKAVLRCVPQGAAMLARSFSGPALRLALDLAADDADAAVVDSAIALHAARHDV